MKKKRLVVLFLVIVIVFGAAFLLVTNLDRQSMASLEISSNSNVLISINGNNLGNGNYTGVFKPGQGVVVVGNYQTRVDLVSGIRTVINRNFNNGESYGETLSFEKAFWNESAVLIITNPIGAAVWMDGVYKGVAPVSVSSLGGGAHDVSISVPGYKEDNFSIQTFGGYNLTAEVDLLKEQAVSNNSDGNRIYVSVLDTPTGFLRVRSAPTTTSDEVGEVHPGEKYLYLGVDKSNGWFDIQLTDTQSGWISNTYAATSAASLKR